MQNYQEEVLLHLAKNGGFKFTEKWFPYTSSWIGPYYVQSIDVCKTGEGYQSAIDGIKSFVGQIVRKSDRAIDVVSGGESRDWPFSCPVAVELGVPHLMIYKDGKQLGPDVQGLRVLHVADLNNEGSSPRDKWVPVIRGSGGIITDIIFLVDRLEDGVEEMKNLGLNSHAVVPLNDEAWSFLKQEGFVSQEIYDSLCEYWADRKAWGMKKILQYPEVLSQLLEKDLFKAMGVFDQYYRLLGEELVNVLDPETCKFIRELKLSTKGGYRE